jgi:hypothetical protein
MAAFTGASQNSRGEVPPQWLLNRFLVSTRAFSSNSTPVFVPKRNRGTILGRLWAWVYSEYEQIQKDQKFPVKPLHTCYNTILVMASRTHRSIYQRPEFCGQFTATNDISCISTWRGITAFR